MNLIAFVVKHLAGHHDQQKHGREQIGTLVSDDVFDGRHLGYIDLPDFTDPTNEAKRTKYSLGYEITSIKDEDKFLSTGAILVHDANTGKIYFGDEVADHGLVALAATLDLANRPAEDLTLKEANRYLKLAQLGLDQERFARIWTSPDAFTTPLDQEMPARSIVVDDYRSGDVYVDRIKNSFRSVGFKTPLYFHTRRGNIIKHLAGKHNQLKHGKERKTRAPFKEPEHTIRANNQRNRQVEIAFYPSHQQLEQIANRKLDDGNAATEFLDTLLSLTITKNEAAEFLDMPAVSIDQMASRSKRLGQETLLRSVTAYADTKPALKPLYLRSDIETYAAQNRVVRRQQAIAANKERIKKEKLVALKDVATNYGLSEVILYNYLDNFEGHLVNFSKGVSYITPEALQHLKNVIGVSHTHPDASKKLMRRSEIIEKLPDHNVDVVDPAMFVWNNFKQFKVLQGHYDRDRVEEHLRTLNGSERRSPTIMFPDLQVETLNIQEVMQQLGGIGPMAVSALASRHGWRRKSLGVYAKEDIDKYLAERPRIKFDPEKHMTVEDIPELYPGVYVDPKHARSILRDVEPLGYVNTPGQKGYQAVFSKHDIVSAIEGRSRNYRALNSTQDDSD